MLIEQAVRDSIVSANIVNKIYWLAAEEDAKSPYVVLKSSEGDPIKTLDGIIGRIVPFEMFLVSDTYLDLKQKNNKLIELILNWSQEFKIGAINIKDVSYSASSEAYEPLLSLYSCSLSILITI